MIAHSFTLAALVFAQAAKKNNVREKDKSKATPKIMDETRNVRQDTWIPTRGEPRPVDRIMQLAAGSSENDTPWMPPVMAGILTSFCTAIILSLIRPPLVVFKKRGERPEHAPTLQGHALLAWSLIAGASAAALVKIKV